MKINLEVLTSVSIKRKKPWSKFAWIGQENEKLLLLDKNSASALSLTTGKTKKSIGKINSVLKTCVTTCISSDGKYLTGVVTSGNLFVWQKDNDALWTIEGLQNLTSVGGKGLPQKIKVFISQNVDVILVVTKLKHVFVWEKDTDSNLDPKKSWLYGVWSAVIVGSGIPLPDTGIKDAVVEATILNDRILGKTALCSFVFNNGNCICISSVHLLWLPGTQLEEDAKLHFKVHWHSVQYAFNNLGPLCQPLKSVRAYVPRYSRDSLLLALAINQKNAFSSRLLFVAPLTRAVLAVDLQGCGARSELSASKKCYQIADLGWTTNDALLAGVTHHGCFFLLSRLGDLLLISTHGCQMDLNYNHFPNLHPLIKVNRVRKKDLANDCNSDSLSSTSNTAEKGIAQRFSVTTHPTLPVILCSDGYLVTCLLLPLHAEKSIGLMEFLVMEANKITFTLHRQLGVFKENLPHLPKASTVATQTPKTKQLAPLFAEKEPLKCGGKQTRKKFEEQIIRDNLSPTTSDFDTASSGSSINIIDYWSNLKASNAGKIILGEMAEMAEVVSPSDKEMLQQTIQEQDVGKWQNVVSLLVSAWGFAVSNPVLWDDKWEVVTSHTVKSFVRRCGLFAAQRLDHSVELAKSNSTSTRPYHPPIDVPKALLFKCLDLLQFSILHQNLMPSAINLIDGVVCVMVHWCSTRPLRARGQLLLEVANVLSKVEAKIMTLYNWEVVSAGGCSHISEMWHPHMYCHSFHRFKLSGAKSECKEQRFLYLEGICKRLSKTWTRLYNVVVSYWRKVQKREVSDKEYEFSKMILIHIQEKLQKRDILHHRKRGKVKAGTFLCSRGCYDEAVHMWNKEKHSLLTGLDPSPYMQKKLGRCLHSILYTLLQNCEFSAALQFINTLLIGNLDNNGATTLASHIANQGSAVINTVLSMARFLTRYFTCTRLFIYPPYKPKVMPSVLDAVDGAKGCMLMSRESVQAVVVGEGLSSTWTPEAALSLLLLSGAFAEAAWFTFALGDWKMAFLLAVVCTELEKRPSSLNKRSNANKLPIGLQPAEIMATKLTTLLGLKKLPSIIVPEPSDDVKSPKLPSKFSKHTTRDNTYFFANRIQVLTDHMTASVLSGVDIVPSLVHGGVSQLERLIKELPLSVPSNYYLPAPPFYCLQDDCESICLASQHEIVSRAEISSTIQLILDIYKSSYTLLPIAFSYAKQLVNLQEGKDLNILKKCTNILDSFNQYQDCSVEIPVFPGESPDIAFIELQRFFRCLCCFVWMLHCRDEMEIKTRKLWKKLETTLPFSTNSKHGNLSLSALYWASRLTPFVSFMDWDWEFYQNVLTLVSESSSTVEVCNVFAACIPDIGVLPPQMDSRVQLLMKLWQTVSVKIDPPVAEVDIHKQHFKVMWLSEYHFIASKNYQDLSNNVQYRFKGLSDSEKDCNKTWPFETDPEFLEFITVFFDVIIHKSAEEHILKSQTPLLRVCVQDILEKELTLMAHDVLATVHKKKLLSFSGDTKLKRFESQKLPHNDIYITVNKKHSRKQKRLGMFQTNSAKPPTAGSKLLKCNSECVNICSTDHHQLASLSLQNVRRTRSMTSVEQKISVKERKSKPSCVIKKGNNCSSNCSPLLNLYSSSFADYFSILTHLANHIVENIDIDGALYKSSHLILWLYRWTNRASLQLQDKICDDPDFSKPQIRIQIPVDHILASMTLFKNKCASHETISTETKCKTSLKHVQDIVMDSPKYAQKPTVNVDLQPSTSKTNTNVSLKKSITEDFINSRYCEKSPKHVVTHLVKPEKPRSDVVDDYHRTQCKKLEDLQSLKGKNYVISSEAPKSVNTKLSYREVVKCKLTRSLDGDNQQMTEHTVHDDFDHKPNVPFHSKTTSCPNKKLTSEIEVKSPSVHHQELQSELQQTKEVQHYGQKDTVTITSGRNIGAVIQSLTPTANIFHESLLKISKMDQSEGFTAVNENSKQAAANVTTGKMLPHLTNIPQCKTNIKLSNSKLVILTSAELLDSSVAECDNTLDDVTSPDSIQMSPPLESRENVELKSKKNTVRFVENLHPPTNSHAFQLLTVDASYLSRAWQDKVAQTMGKSHLQAGRPKQKLSKRVPHFLRLKAERDNDDSSSQGTDGNTISKANNEDYSGVTDDEKTVDSERLRGGGSRHKQPLPLFTAPPVPLASQSTPLQNPNRFPIQPMSPHRGYPLLHLPHNYQEKPQTIKQSELCHVCNQDNSCNDNIYVQGRLRQYWQDVQQASFCPATITDPFAPSHPASHPLVPIPLTVPCCPYIAPTWSNSAPYYRQDSSLAQYHLSPYSVILSRAPQTVHPRENISVEPHHRPRAQSETSFVPTSNTVTSQQNMCLNKFISLSTVSSASTQNENIVTEGIIGSRSNCDKSRTFHKVAASLSVSAPNITSNTPVYGPTSDIAVVDHPSAGLIETTQNLPSVVPKKTMQCITIKPDKILPKISVKVDSVQSTVSHGEVSTIQSPNLFCVSQTDRCKELLKLTPVTVASTKFVTQTEPVSIPDCHKEFLKEVSPRNPVTSTENKPSTTFLSGNTHQKCHPNAITLLNESTPNHSSPLPMDRAEFAESHFRAVHELEKAKRLLKELHQQKNAATKEVQTDADLAVVSGQGNVCNSSNRQTSGQDTADQTYTSHSELKNIAPTHTEELLDLSTKQLRPTFELKQTLISESNEFSQPHQPLDQESRHNDVPALLQQNVEESSPQPRNISSRTSDPPTDELPRKLAMGSVQRRLQSITNHINIMEKMSMELETDFQDTKKLLRTNGKDNVLGKNTDSLPSANCLSTIHDEPVVPFNCYLSRGNEFNLSSGKETQTTFNRARMKYSTCIGIGRSRSLSPPTSSSKSIPSYQGKNIFFKCWSPNPKEQKHHATAGSLETSPHRLIKCGSFQQLLVGTKADSIQDVVSSEMSTFSHQDRARARQVQKDTHFKLRMQEACQLMDEIVAAESGRNSSSVNSPVTSPALGRGSHNSTVKNIVSSPKKQTIPISDESSKCCCLEKRQNQTFLYDFDMNDDDDSIMSYLDTLQVCLHSGSENEDIEQSQESLGKVIADCAHTIKRVGPLSRRNGNENAHLKTNLNKRVKSSFDYSDGTSSVYTIPAAKFSVHNSSSNNSFGRTYSVGQHITVASTISEVSDETEPTSNCLKGNPTGQHCRLTSKMKTMKNKVPRKKLAVRMTKAVLLRKKLCKAKESQGTKSQPNARSSNCNQQRIKYLPPSSRTVKRGQMNQNPSHLNKIRSRSTVATNAKPSGPLSRTSRWREVPGNILSLSHRSAVEDIPDGDQTTEDFSYNGFEEEFFTDED